jgi:septum site-determining protein MinC
MDESPSPFQIKGIRDGLLVSIAEGPWSELEAALLVHIDERSTFFNGAHLVMDVGTHALKVAELSEMRDRLSERGISLRTVLSESPLTEATAQNLGLATRLAKPRPVASTRPVEEVPENAALWVKGPLRSGAHVEYMGNVVVIGDVNPGAEIIAGGSIIVWGRLRGVVHAGAQGDGSVMVCALELAPTQLRIAGQIAVSPRKERKPQPEMAHLVDGQIRAVNWQA